MSKLYIDDMRPCPEGWVLAKTSAEAIRILEENPPFDVISFDHDLGGDDTSRIVVLWLCEHEDKWPQRAHIHSMNPVGREWLSGMINRYGCGVSF